MSSSSQAATSYLLVQGPFGSGAALETHKWKVVYDAGTLNTGLDLLTAVFGNPLADGTYTDAFSSTYEYYSAGNATQGVGYIDFLSGAAQSLLVETFTLGGTEVSMNPAYSPGWNYYNAGGSGSPPPVFLPGSYANAGAWTYSGDGINTRLVADGSFDGWVFGSTFPEAPVAGAGNLPTLANFSGSQTLVSAGVGYQVFSIGAVPEPGRVLLILLGLAAGVLRRSRSVGHRLDR